MIMKRKCRGLFSGLMCGLAVLAVSGCGAGKDGTNVSLQEPVVTESIETDAQTVSEEETTAAQGNAGTTQESLVHAEWAEEIQPEWSGYETFTADEGDESANVVFTSEGTVRDFKLTVLTMREVDDQGNIAFDANTLYTMDVLTPEHPLIVQMSFPGTMPTYGISYRVDEDDETVRCFTVQISGKDGSLLLEEAEW